MKTKEYKYIIVQKQAGSDDPVIAVTGDKTRTYDDFIREFDENRDQVGIVYVGLPQNERLVLITFAPSKLGHSIPQIAKQFKLPKNPRRVQSLGFIPYVAHDLEDLNESRVGARAYTHHIVLAETYSLDNFNSTNPLWADDSDDGFVVPAALGHHSWTKLFDLQAELKRKISDVTVDDDVIDTWNGYVGNNNNGYALISSPKGSMRLHAAQVRTGSDLRYDDLLKELKTEPLFALVFTQDLVEKTGIREPVLLEWNPAENNLVERTVTRDRLKPLQSKLNGPYYPYVAENLQSASLDSLVDFVKHQHSQIVRKDHV